DRHSRVPRRPRPETLISPLFRLDGRIAAIVGAGSGIGEAVAIASAEHGAHVSCFDIDAAAAARTAGRITSAGRSAGSGGLDVRSANDVKGAFERLAAGRGTLDIVISTPGVNVRKPLLSYTDDDFDRVVSLNLKGSFNVLREAGRVLTKQRAG